MIERGLRHSFRAAAWGLLTTVATQRNMKVHVTSAVMVMIVGMALPLDLASRTALLFCVALVFFAEILNTALESFVDLHIKEYQHQAMMAKDASAAGVLALSLATVLILADVLVNRWAVVEASGAAVQRSLLYGLPLTAAVAALLWAPVRWWLKLLLGGAAGALAVPLLQHSVDPIFSILLGLLILLSAVARPRPEVGSPAQSPDSSRAADG